MAFKDRLKEARLAANLTQEQIANIIGVAKSTFTGYEKGNSEPNMATVQKIMDALNIDANFLWQDEMRNTTQFVVSIEEKEHIKKYRTLSEHGKKMADTFLDMQYEYEKEESMKIKESYPMIPKALYGCSPSAGVGNYLPDDIDESAIMVPDTPKTRKADYVLKVDGKSMEPEYMDGDLVLVKKQDQVDIGEVGIYLVDGEALIKEAQNGYLHSLNPEFGNIELNENSEVHCMGKVIGKL